MPDVLPGQTTLGLMRELVARKTQQPTPTDDTNITIATYDAFINQAYRNVSGLLVDSFQDYFINPFQVNPFQFLTVNGQWLYPLPNDFWKLLRMECWWQPGSVASATTMVRYMNLQENALQQLACPAPGLYIPEYRITGNSISLRPKPPQAGLQIFVHYVPVFPDMVDRGTITVGDVDLGDQVNIAAVAGINTLLNASDYFTFTCATEAADGFFVKGASPAETAANLAAAILLSNPFNIGGNQIGTGVKISVDLNVITVTLNQPMAVSWYTSTESSPTAYAQAITLAPYPQVTQYNPSRCWSNCCTILNGFNELVAVDAAIQIRIAQDKSPVEFERRQAALWVELRTEANNRNAAQNGRITNVRNWRGLGRGGFYGGLR